MKRALLLLGIAGSFAVHAEPTPLTIGGSLSLTMPANEYTTDVYVDVPASAEQLRINLTAANAAQNVDLLLRFDSPFPAQGAGGQGAEAEWLFQHAQFVSAGRRGEESVVINRASRQPLRAGRLHLALLNFDSASAPVTITATLSSASEHAPIEVVFNDPGTSSRPCNTSGWEDGSARQPVRGNSGTTLGQQRKLALQEAARLLAAELRPRVPIRVRACWDSLEFNANTGTGVLAQAGPAGFYFNDRSLGDTWPGVAQPYVFYSKAATAHQAGVRSCQFLGEDCTQPSADLVATFNLAVDNASQVARRFDYGFTAASGTGTSFISVAIHELAHGLGFVGLVELRGENGKPIGSRLTEYDDIYGYWTLGVDSSGRQYKPFLRLSDDERRAALTSGEFLVFAGPATVVSERNPRRSFAAPGNAAVLHAPGTVEPGSTYSHLHAFSHGGETMNAQYSRSTQAPRNLGLARDMLYDLGFDPAPKSAPVVSQRLDAQYLDASRNGHGFDFRRVAGTTDTYFLVFYTYDEAGNPEWYTSLGRVVDGLFVPSRNELGDSLARFQFRPGQQPQSVAVATGGQVRLDFDKAINAPTCHDPLPGRPRDDSLGVMTWTLAGVDEQWCVQKLVAGREGVAVDYSGIWYAPGDGGWGITFQSFPGEGGADGLAGEIYYPDASGRGRWAIFSTPRYVPGMELTLFQVRGYCRTCAAPASLGVDPVGKLTVNLRPPSAGPSEIEVDVTYPGSEGGRFQRSRTQIVPGSEPNF